MNRKATVRPARPDDLDKLADLAIRAFADTYAAHNDAADVENHVRNSLSREKLQGEFGDAANVFLVAFMGEDDDVVGYAKLRIGSGSASVDTTQPIEIERLYADSHVIGKGIGSALMQACLTTAHSLECHDIWLGVWEQNPRAILFYERWGFATVGEHKFTLGSDIQRDLLMSRKINDCDS